MGMFDYVRSSYDLGPQFTNVVCQTKDIVEDYGGTMNHYWLDPAGYLWCPSYIGTNTFEIIEENDPLYQPDRKFLNYQWVPTGNHGKYQVYPITKYIKIYPERWQKGEWKDWPQLLLHFKYGKLVEYMEVTQSETH